MSLKEEGGTGKRCPKFPHCTIYGSRLHQLGYHVGRGFTPLLHATPSPSIHRYIPSIASWPRYTSAILGHAGAHRRGVKPLPTRANPIGNKIYEKCAIHK